MELSGGLATPRLPRCTEAFPSGLSRGARGVLRAEDDGLSIRHMVDEGVSSSAVRRAAVRRVAASHLSARIG